ncbi:hypothetical protein LTR94_032520, partial [Friedmanniomyces endolithicus]
IERLLERRGAETKAAEDLPRLAAKREQLEIQVRNLHKEFGSAIAVVPTRTQVTELRQVFNGIASARAAADQAESELGDVRSRLARLEQQLIELPADATLTTLVSAVDAARQLGADFDERCDAAAETLNRTAARRDALLAQLKPWS